MAKSPDAFRTISEVADWLGVQAHVLRFWESKFTQVKPVKRAGGRRYYRPADMLLLGGIKRLLHDDGLTIKGVQKVLREEGINHVAALSQPLDELTMSQFDEGATAAPVAAAPAPSQTPPIQAESEHREVDATSESDRMAPEKVTAALEIPQPALEDVPSKPLEEPVLKEREPAVTPPASAAPVPEEPPLADPEATHSTHTMDETSEAPEPPPDSPPDEEDEQPLLPAFLHRPLAPERDRPASDNTPATAEGGDAAREPAVRPAAPTPTETPAPPSTESPPETKPLPESEPEPAPPPRPQPRKIVLPEITAEAEIDATSAALSQAFALRTVTPEQARALAPLLERLTALRNSMAAQRGDEGRAAKD